MGTPVPISLGLRSNPGRASRQVSAARLVNCFAEEAGEEGKSQWVITATAGLVDFGSALSGGGIRAKLAVNDKLYVVAGRNLHVVTPDGRSTRVGGIPTDGNVFMRRNRRDPVQIAIVSDGLYFVIDDDTLTLTEVSDPDLPSPTCLAYLDGFGILPFSRGRYMITSVDDFTMIDGLDEGTAATNPDEIVLAMELGREVVLLGTESTEWHQNTGDADFPLTRSQATETGWLEAGSIARVDTPTIKTLIGVARDHTVRIMEGYATRVISTNEIEGLIRALAEQDRATELRGVAWSAAGRFFYCLSCADWTRCYDAKTGGWHDRESYGSTRWRISTVTSFAGKLIAGDATTGQLYEMSEDAFDEAGNPHILSVVTPQVHAFPYRTRHNALYIDAAKGVGLNTAAAQNLDPTLLLDWSNDFGKTFATEIEVALGRLGQEARRLQPLRRLGMAGPDGRAYRLRIPAAVRKILIAMSIDFDKLAA